MKRKKVVKVKRKNKINAELSGGSSQPVGLSATLGEPHPLLSSHIPSCFLHFIFKFILPPARSLPEGHPGSEGASGPGSDSLTTLDCCIFLL